MLQLHRSERADRLVEALGDVLATSLPDPMAVEVVAVPTRGVERWLTQRLSHRLGAPPGSEEGVCANISFPFPGILIGQAIAGVCDVDPDTDPWRPERCVWTLLELIESHGEDPELVPLMAHLRAATPDDRLGRPGPLRRFATARHVADLFDHYSVHRPDLVRSWAAGVLAHPAEDPTPAWQGYLWRLLRSRLGMPSPAERFADAARRLVEVPHLLDLPERVSLFGLTRLPTSHLEVLQAVASARQVHLFLLHPSGHLWEEVAAAVQSVAADLGRADDPTARLPGNPLLRSWGRDAREMQLVLAARGVTGGEYRPVDQAAAPVSLLGRVQADIRSDRQPPGAPVAGVEDHRPVLDPTDRSLQVHACHGRARQVEVGRDAVLHLLAADETLEPRDVIVMCPDIETFAPLIHAAFGPDDPMASVDADGEEAAGTGLPRLRVRLADRSVRQTNPLLSVAAQLLELAGARITASEVLDLASRPPVARRFRFDQDDLTTLEQWMAETGVRWGLDAEHRRPWALQQVEANTWAAGLDRLLLGVTMAEGDGRMFGSTLPYDDVPSSAVDLAGRFAELIQRLGTTLDRLTGRQPVSAWVDALVTGTELLAVSAPSDNWQGDQLRRVMAEVGEAAEPAEPAGAAEVAEVGEAAEPAEPAGAAEVAEAAGSPPTSADGWPELSLAEVRDLLDSRLQGRPTRANFRTGDLTVCTLVPMRSVPHRVVVVLGLDDGAFPRHPETDGDDLLLASPRVGDRDARSEDRQLLLDAVLAATENLIITYSGRDERTNRTRPPAVPVAELLDTVAATVRLADGSPARDRVVFEHPLQPFDRRNFTRGELCDNEAWSYDRVHLAGSRAFAKQAPADPWLPGPLPPLHEPVLQLDDLVRFVQHPVQAFLRRRLGLYLSDRTDELQDALPIDLDSLEKWGVGDRLLQACLAGADPERAAAAERTRGLLPPGRLADNVLTDIREEVDRLAIAIAGLGFQPGPADSLDIHLDLPNGRGLIGTVADCRTNAVLVCTYSRLGPKHRLGAWVRFLAVSAARPELDITVISVGRGRTGNQPPQAARLDSLAATPAERRQRAFNELAVILDLYDRGLRAPLPLACKTSAAWAEARHRGKDEHDAGRIASGEWAEGNFPERNDAEHRYVWGTPCDFERLTEQPPAADERGSGGPASETSRFATMACRLWYPLLAHEHLGPAV
jgi:exodeoxyribonuclease V gamma subunit